MQYALSTFVVVLSLQGALPDDKPLDIYILARGEDVISAFALSPRYNRAAHEVDASDLVVADGSVTGNIVVRINSDGYVPADGESFACEFRISAAASPEAGFRGTYEGVCDGRPVEGAISGETSPVPREQPIRLTLGMNDAVRFEGRDSKPWHRRLTLKFAVRGSEVYGVKLAPPGSIVDINFAPRVDAFDLEVRDGMLTGEVVASIAPNGERPVEFRYLIDAAIIGPKAAGSFTIARDGEDLPGGTLLGDVRYGNVPSPGDALFYITLHDAAGAGRPLNLYLAAREGRISHGFAATPNFNNSTHDVDVGGLSLSEQGVAGSVKVTVRPDPWTPADGEPFTASYRIDAARRDAELSGEYEGALGDSPVAGRLDGELRHRPAPGPVTAATIKLEDGLTGGNKWQNRAFFSLELEGEGVTGGVSNNHTDLTGEVTGGDLRLDGDELTARWSAEIAPGGGVDAGEYSFAARGRCVGRMCTGRFQTLRDGRIVKTGQFWAVLKTSER
ncbi:MAG: hypothetical protein ACP5HU_10105 [Phycisphaerae bacterium]